MYVFACNPKEKTHKLDLSVANSTALDYYNLGWQQIMDYGQYGAAEASYRKAIGIDPNFLIGKSVLARLTLDLGERLSLYKELQIGKEVLTGDERLLIEVYSAFVKLTNVREQTPEKAKDILNKALGVAKKNLGIIVRKYPDEVYLKSEYIEILHALYGARPALDSLEKLRTPDQKRNPFLLGYQASMEAELGLFDLALLRADLLESIISDASVPKSYAVYADIYLKMDSLEKAKQYVDKGFALDKRNLDISRLKTKIDTKLQSTAH
ncbi:MAG: hypothetical protein AAFZ89_04935 [Bacteroidota bacterium]